MRHSFKFWALAIPACLTCILAFVGYSVVSLVNAIDQSKLAEERRHFSYLLADELRQSSDDLTRLARTYVVTGDASYEQQFLDILAIRNGEKSRPVEYSRIYWDFVAVDGKKPRPDGEVVALQVLMQQAGFTDEEFEKLREAQANSDNLVNLEVRAMNAVKGLFLDKEGRYSIRSNPDFELARRLMHSKRYHRYKAEIMGPIDDFYVLLEKRTLTGILKAEAGVQQAKKQLLVALILLAFALMTIAVMIRSVSRPILALVDVVQSPQATASMPGINRGDEIGLLARAFKDYLDQNQGLTEDLQRHQAGLEQEIEQRTADLQAAKERLQTEGWVKSSLLAITSDLQREASVDDMATTFLSRVMPLIDCQLGTMYLLNKTGDKRPHLSTIATYGYRPSETAPQTFDLGQGLVGQVGINKQPLYVEDIPSDYISVVSGIGDRQPVHIALIPILFQGHLRAIAEFASFHPFSMVHRELIGQLASTLGIMIDAISANELTSGLLQETTDLAQRLEKERLVAIQANQSKSDFLANMSHEIRTPMNGILGTSELMMDCGLNTRQQQYAKTIFHSSEMLLALINDILDFSKIEAGELALESAPFDLLRVVEDVAELLTPKAMEKTIDLSLRFVPGTQRFLIGDSVRIRQILCNLIGNAIKFTESGYVLITVEEIDDIGTSDDDLTFRLSIKDTGIGIPEDKQDHVFGRFNQADDSTTRKFGGTGLGLAICKKLVELMDGSIGLQSKVGEGSTVSFTIVLRRDANAQDCEPDRSLLEGVKVLMVDDLEVNRSILCEQVSAVGMESASAENGQEALDALRDAHRDGRPFDFAILDYMMPGENGLQLAERIGLDPDLAKTTLIMLSSAVPDIEQHPKAWISSFLTKPARQMQLLDMLTALQTSRIKDRPLDADQSISNTPSVKRRATETAFDGLQVLIVEDNRVNRGLIMENLGRLGCRVTSAENGREAVAMVHEQTFDMILMDCQMPVMDGFEASRIIATKIAKGEIARTPIIALTANAMQGDRERCLEAGMDDYASKPIRKKNLIDMLTRWCVTNEDRATLASTSATSPALPGRAAARPTSFAIDRDMLIEKEAMLGDQFPVILEFFLEDAAKYVDQIALGLASKNKEAIAAAAHPLRSSSREIGAILLSELAKNIEESARATGDDVASIATLAEPLKTSFDEVRSELEEIINRGNTVNSEISASA